MRYVLVTCLLFLAGCAPCGPKEKVGDCVAMFKSDAFGWVEQINGDGVFVVKLVNKSGFAVVGRYGVTKIPTKYCTGELE